MGLRKKSKVTAEFNMSSLTDIIFLLLIFFMLTSSMVVPNALNLKLPGKSQQNIEAQTKPFNVDVDERGYYFVNGKRITLESIELNLQKVKENRRGGPVSVTISPSSEVPNEYVVALMDVAYRLEIDAIMTDPR
ncbi:MAG TPA: biopolymer transporter ExbD [Saprospirales bacterium]|nr:biopolymer transporter ExbD [Saprospirales bacterium]HAY71632.1 biopolymer transporter ExbD [Saprospirales bacterium]HRQ30403.1 biopolymer transporter ExbD [Saprospiraceae bacterium]